MKIICYRGYWVIIFIEKCSVNILKGLLSIYSPPSFSFWNKIISRSCGENVMREGLIIFTLFSVLLVGETIAEPAEGAYLGAKFGLTHNQHSCGESAVKCDRRDIGSGLFAGYDFNRRYAAEISVFNLGGSSATYPNVDLEGELFAADATLKYSRHFLSESRIFAKLGVAYWQRGGQGLGRQTGWLRLYSYSRGRAGDSTVREMECPH
ncbi:MAG: hypothetical protein NVV73_22475 [Cellvibrionaceae bacterium]|nr:hypothetical protein [Cellvibrionaceae bacterium]